MNEFSIMLVPFFLTVCMCVAPNNFMFKNSKQLCCIQHLYKGWCCVRRPKMKEFHYYAERERETRVWNSNRVNELHIKAYQICIFRVAICAPSNFLPFVPPFPFSLFFARSFPFLSLPLSFSASIYRYLSQIDGTNDKITSTCHRKMGKTSRKKWSIEHSYRKYVYL